MTIPFRQHPFSFDQGSCCIWLNDRLKLSAVVLINLLPLQGRIVSPGPGDQDACGVVRIIQLDNSMHAKAQTDSVYIQLKDSRVSLHSI